MSESQISNLKSQIFLVGFMASGKSTVGPVLAARLQRPFIDLDRLIEAQAGGTIFELIQRAGEARFRQLETQTLAETAQGEPAVIAPGGGAITRAENRALMQDSGVLIWLDAPFELCWQRIRQDGITRPLAPDEATAHTRYEQRLPLYQAAPIHIAIQPAQSAAEIAAACLRQLHRL
ncbi:MAG: shikimate kinase [Acidobacteria bacterium]|nr:shikimate kinase [Acidobacteriota bacterium]MBI3425878.1 shikimate kinase [Acidobacteriota bacterium]